MSKSVERDESFMFNSLCRGRLECFITTSWSSIVFKVACQCWINKIIWTNCRELNESEIDISHWIGRIIANSESLTNYNIGSGQMMKSRKKEKISLDKTTDRCSLSHPLRRANRSVSSHHCKASKVFCTASKWQREESRGLIYSENGDLIELSSCFYVAFLAFFHPFRTELLTHNMKSFSSNPTSELLVTCWSSDERVSSSAHQCIIVASG